MIRTQASIARRLKDNGSMVNPRNASVIRIMKVLLAHGTSEDHIVEYLEAILDGENIDYRKLSDQEIIQDYDLYRKYSSDEAIASGIVS